MDDDTTFAFDCQQAIAFLDALGKAQDHTWFRSIGGGRANGRRYGKDLPGFTPAELAADCAAGSAVYVITGNASTATGKNPKGESTGSVCDADIASCPALFVEWDDQTIDWQLTAWQQLGLPEPTLMVTTGGKSVHAYWVLDQPLPPEQWKPIQSRLVDHCKGDTQCKNPSRLMRLPGSVYFDKKTGQPTGQARIHTNPGHRYSLGPITACLPPEPTPPAATIAPPSANGALPPRDLEAINAAASFIPKRVGGNGTYEADRNALCGCSAALAEAGHSDPDAAALALLGHLWPSEGAAFQVLRSTTTRDPASFWAIAGKHGYELKRHDLKGHQPKSNNHTQGTHSPLSKWEQLKADALVGTDSDPLLVHDALWNLLLQRAGEIIASNRRISQQKLAIKSIAKDLGFNPTNQEVADIYDQLDNTLAAYEPPVAPGGEFTTFSQSWLLHELILVGLNLLVGMPGAGKSRLLVAIIRALLHGQETFIGRRLLPSKGRAVLIVGTDQDRQQWGALLEESGLASITSSEIIDGQEKIAYRLHSLITLHTSGGGFKLDADGLRYIRDWCKANPGGLLIIDSLSAVLPPGISEGDETAGRLMRQIEIARQGNAAIVTHHTNKQSALTGELGVYSGSGSGTIDRAVSRHIGLSYDTHLEAGKEKLHTESPKRIITSQKRGAVNQKLVVENGSFNTWDYISTAAEDRELKRQADAGDPLDRLKGWKKAIYSSLTNDWQSTSQVIDQLPPGLKNKADPLRQTRNALRDLETDGLIRQDKTSIGEGRWKLPTP